MTTLLAKGRPRSAARKLAIGDRGLRTDLVVGVLAALATLLLASLALKVWRGDLGVPFSYREETQYYLMLAKAIEEHGGYFENPSLGAPFGQELHDFAVGTDRLNLDLLRLLLLFGGPAAAVNLFYLLTFPLAAGATYLVFRLLAIPRAAAVVCSLLFALAPYHFERGQGNLFLSAYWVVPLGAYLVLATLAGRPLFPRRARTTGLRAFATGRGLLAATFCVAVASTGIYYAVFTMLLLAGAIVVALVARAGRSAVVGGLTCLALILGVALIHLSPSIAYRLDNGPNPGAERHPRESELYGLKLSDLLFPIDLHRVEPLARFTAEYKAATPIRSEPMGLGPVAAGGFVVLLLVALAVLVAGPARAGPPVLRHAAAAALIAFLIGTIGGVSTIVAQLLTPQIRGWNRISIFIAFFGLLAVAVGLAALGRRLGPQPLRRGLFAAALAGVLAFGLYNQVTYRHVPPYELASDWSADRAFVRQLEERLPNGAAVFQLPHLGFPETGREVDLYENDLLRGFIHSDDLRWSFGATKGRPEEWTDDLARMPAATVLDAAAAAGFAGILVDRLGYRDRGSALEIELRRRLASEPLVSASRRHAFFDLRAYANRLEAVRPAAELAAFRDAVLHPLGLEETGFLPLERHEGLWYAWADDSEAELRVVNTTDGPRSATLDGLLDRLGGGRAEIEITFPDRAPARYVTLAPIREQLMLPPGETAIRFATAAPEVPEGPGNRGRPHYFLVARLTLTDAAFEPFLPR